MIGFCIQVIGIENECMDLFLDNILNNKIVSFLGFLLFNI